MTFGYEIRGKRKSDGFEEAIEYSQALYNEVEKSFFFFWTRKEKVFDESTSRIHAANMAYKYYNPYNNTITPDKYTDITIYQEYDKFDDASGFILIWKNGKWV
jgi:hypothetical protein